VSGEVHVAPVEAGTVPGAIRRGRGRHSNATRYLCAAAHLDPGFAEKVLDELVYQPHRAVAPSYGIDLGPIVRHCLAARRRLLRRSLAITAVFLAAVLLIFSGSAQLLLTIYLALTFLRFVRDFLTRDLTGAASNLGICLVIAVLMQAVFRPLNRLQGHGSGSSFRLMPDLGALVLIGLVVWLILFVDRIAQHRMIVKRLGPRTFAPERSPREGRIFESRVQYLEAAQHGNITVYAQTSTNRPFVGSGKVVDAWSFATPLVPARDTEEPSLIGGPERSSSLPEPGVVDLREIVAESEGLTTDELYARTRAALAALAGPRLPEAERMIGLSVQDRVFVSGLMPPDHPFLDRSRQRPLFRVPAAVVSEIGRRERGPERHYQTVRVSTWDGELEVTAFVHLSLRGHMLFVEFVATTLPTIAGAFHAVDRYERLNGAAMARAATASFLDVFRMAPFAPARVVEAVVDAMRRWQFSRDETQSIDDHLAFDYGARTSVRELSAGTEEEIFFQRLDVRQQINVVERQVLDALVQALAERALDVEDLVRRANSITDHNTVITLDADDDKQSEPTPPKPSVIRTQRRVEARPRLTLRPTVASRRRR